VAVRLTDGQVREVREKFRNGARQVDLAEEYGISQNTVSSLVLGRTRRACGGPISPGTAPPHIGHRFHVDRPGTLEVDFENCSVIPVLNRESRVDALHAEFSRSPAGVVGSSVASCVERARCSLPRLNARSLRFERHWNVGRWDV
jgi:hypothetical protein